MTTLKCANIADDQVGFAAAGVHHESSRRAVECGLVGRRLVLFPTKPSLVGQSKTQLIQCRSESRSNFQGSFQLNSGLGMGLLGEIKIEISSLQKILVDECTSGAFAPHPRLFALRQLNLK